MCCPMPVITTAMRPRSPTWSDPPLSPDPPGSSPEFGFGMISPSGDSPGSCAPPGGLTLSPSSTVISEDETNLSHPHEHRTSVVSGTDWSTRYKLDEHRN